MFKKVYPMSKKPVDFRDNPFRLVEVSRNGSFPKKAGFRYTDEDLEDLMDEDLEVSTNPIYGNAGYDDEENDCEYGSLGHSDEDDESETFGVSSSDDDDDGHHSYNPESTDWNNVDFGAEDWSKY